MENQEIKTNNIRKNVQNANVIIENIKEVLDNIPVTKERELSKTQFDKDFAKYIKENEYAIRFSSDKELEIIITKFLKSNGGKQYNQYPPEEMLNSVKMLRNFQTKNNLMFIA